ncbi:CfaE/CblD family pilus tip adhesin [Burkholderia contaminans]|uniref:CfaE/CblD family pilus tip adhesin n=1 Tax=Burkholderia contaminans TaxID=488447 RepID=UPI002D7FE9D5|nr:CfaE/CblD family pilus tip adhesin [Burkholderia contaminans]
MKLSFKEETTGATAVLTLHGENAYARNRDCSGNIIPTDVSNFRVPIEMAQSATVTGCDTIGWDGRALFVKIPAAELKKLPSGGTWKGILQLNLRMWSSGPAPMLGIFRAAITLNTADKNNIQVYLPEFASATPIVDLKLRKLPNGSRMSGTSNVDMCLYDGYNSQSTWFDVSASDGLTIDRRDKGQYSVLLDSDKSGAYESRVDYTVSLTYAGKKIALPNNETVRLQGVNNSAGRSVTLPGISVPVVCTPTPLTLETPEFQSVWKRPGTYSNKLTITFTPSSASL